MSTWKHLNVAGFKTLSFDTEKEGGSVYVLDTRDKVSFSIGHIPGATLLSDESMEALLVSGNRTQPLVTCCYYGHTSQETAELLAQEGFVEVYSLDGGYAAWVEQA